MMSRSLVPGLLLCAAWLLVPAPARAFVHVVRDGETLAQLAQRVYGDARLETVLVGANALDSQGGSSIVAGMRLDLPAPAHVRCVGPETWAELATAWLGDPKRADTLARFNKASAWIRPTAGLEIAIPYVLAHIAAQGDHLASIAKRYYGDANRAWELDLYNNRKGAAVRRGDVVLVPLLDLALTEEGRAEARAGEERERSEGGGDLLEAQRRAEAELPNLLAARHDGRYVDVVALGNQLLGMGLVPLSPKQTATVHRALLEAYVALDALGAAAAACAAWRVADPEAKLDRSSVSPKIRAACGSKDGK